MYQAKYFLKWKVEGPFATSVPKQFSVVVPSGSHLFKFLTSIYLNMSDLLYIIAINVNVIVMTILVIMELILISINQKIT